MQKTDGEDQTPDEVNTLAAEKVQEEIQKGNQRLILENFKLQDLAFLIGTVWDTLIEIDLHKNYLSSIDTLNQFRNLKIIKASDNYIQEITLNLQKLEELDVHNNYINKFPILTQLPRIARINLNANKIEDFRVEFKPPSSLSIQHLDIGKNSIDFPANNEFQSFLDKMKKLKNLKVLIVSNNPFADEKRFDQIVAQLPQLEIFNYERADEYRRQVLDDDKKKDIGKKDKKKGKGKKFDKTTFYFPTIELLCYNLEAANSHPSYALDHLKDLAQDVDKILDHLEMIDEYFAKGKDEVEINDMIEDFMQNSLLLINNQFELQNIMLTILSKLSIIKFYNFGVNCFNTLKDLMIAGKDMESRVIEVIKKEVILKLTQQNPEMIPASLIQGLYELVNETEKAEILSGLYENCFPSWLRILQDRVLACKKIATIYENNDHFDAILALINCSLKDHDKNIEKAAEKDLIPILADILNETTLEQKRYIDCLNIVENIASVNGEAADKFIDKNVHLNIMKNIRASIIIYKKNNDLKDEDSKDTEEKLKLKYLTISAEIDCLGGLLNADKMKREFIVKDSLLDDMLQITSHFKTDPVLLTAICKFAKQLFSRDEVKNNENDLRSKIKKMANLIQLVPYLGLKKYGEALQMAKRYYDPSTFADKEKAIDPKYLDDIVVQKLFISIINLINFFCEEAENSQSPPFLEVSQALNDNQREDALFHCLEVPNDDVKLAVVECLNNVPLSEFDQDEISNIIKLIGNYKNIGAGKTELVLAKIFWILTKLTKDKEQDSAKNFRLKFGEKAINEGLDILIRNQTRHLDDEDEEQEKLTLSISCLHFLKFASKNTDMKKYMINKHEQFKVALFADEQNTSYNMMKCPVEIEETWLGRNMDVLLHAISGNDTIEPYNYVSFRLMQRIADVLMNRVEVDAIDPFQGGANIIETLELYYKNKFKQRKAREMAFWEDPEEDFIYKIQQSEEQFNSYCKQHNWFTTQNGIPLLRMFLTKKVPSFEQYLKREFDPQYDAKGQQLDKLLKAMKEKVEFKELDHQKKENEKKGQAIVMDEEEEEEKKGIDVLRMALQQEELGQNYDPTKTSDHFIQQSSTSSSNVENIKKRDHRQGVQNMRLRSLCIAAYLRCLYAAIEYAPKPQLRLQAIKSLKDIFVFRNITQLCDTTGWLEAGIGAKYLRVFRHIIKAPQTDSIESVDNLPYYEGMSIAIRKMLSQIMIKIKNEQQKQLSSEDKVLIYELSATCQLMCKQCQLFIWSTVQVKQLGSHSRTRRSPQEKIIDKQISLLFPSQSILTFIAIIFRDMNIAYKIFESENKSAEGEVKETQYIKIKNDTAREYIKLFLGDYLSKCKDNKYDVLEAFMKGVVFDKKKLRESFLQEILKAHEDASYMAAIEKYIYDKNLGIGEERERVVLFQWVLIAFDGKSIFDTRLIVFTNKGIHIMKVPSGKPCSVCPPENLCPNGPRPESKFTFDQIIEVVNFPNLPQQLLMYFQQGGIISKDKALQASIIFPTFTGASESLKFLKEVINNQGIPLNTDMLLTGSIAANIDKDQKNPENSEIKLARFISHNPSKGFLGFGIDELIIQNCSLLVLTNKEIITMKENWNTWYYINDEDKIERIIRKIKHQNEEDQNKILSLTQQQQESNLKIALLSTFTVGIRKNLADIQDLHVHKGKDPVIEIQFDGSIEKFIFQCDYSRQQFIEALLEVKMGDSEEAPQE